MTAFTGYSNAPTGGTTATRNGVGFTFAPWLTHSTDGVIGANTTAPPSRTGVIPTTGLLWPRTRT